MSGLCAVHRELVCHHSWRPWFYDGRRKGNNAIPIHMLYCGQKGQGWSLGREEVDNYRRGEQTFTGKQAVWQECRQMGRYRLGSRAVYTGRPVHVWSPVHIFIVYTTYSTLVPNRETGGRMLQQLGRRAGTV